MAKPSTPIQGWDGKTWKHPLYQRWAGMRARCNNPNHVGYAIYGGRGISVCARWKDFGLFVLDMGMPPTPNHTIDRIESNGNYEPENCKWSTTGEQSRNTRRNVYVTVDGESKTVRDWEIANGVIKGAYQRRIDLGWPHIDAVTQPIIPGKALYRRSGTENEKGV